MSITRLLVTGKTGQLGAELQQSLKPLGEVVALDRAGLDLYNADSIRTAVQSVRPQIIVNAAAYTAVDKAESDPDLATRINGVAPGILAEEAKRIGARFVHYSTDYVFDGTKADPYVETDPTNPLSTYGRSKLAGEEAVSAVGGRYLIFRTSWVYAAHGNNFVRTMLRLARQRPELRIVHDQIGAPTWARSIAEFTKRALEADSIGERSGIYHLTATGSVSWFGFAERIFALARQRDAEFPIPKLTPIPATEYPTPARRPANSRLSNSLFKSHFGCAMHRWEDMLEQCMNGMPLVAPAN